MKKHTEISYLKGIGIIAVVLGHTNASNIVPIIYYWHLPLFLFVIGLTYNKEKYANNVSRLIAARLHSFFPMYMVYMVLLGLMRNVFYKMGILQDVYQPYDICTGMDALVNYLKLNAEPFAGALWFMFPFFWATLLYGVIYLAIYKLRLSERGECIFSFVCCTLCSVVGFFYVGKEFFLSSFFDIALVIMPIVWAGGMYRKLQTHSRKFFNIIGFALGIMVLLIAHYRYNLWIILDQRKYVNPLVFYLLAIIGIYCCICVAKLLDKKSNNIVSRCIGEIGNYSMDIMTLHFLFFKLVDFIYFTCFKVEDNFVLSDFPHSLYSKTSCIVYTLVGVSGPILVRMILKYMSKLANEKIFYKITGGK